MIKSLHVALAFLTVAGFIIRAGWSYGAPALLERKWVRFAPHVIDTLLLTLGVVLALNLPGGPMQGWLGAKLLGLLVYIGLGVVTLRGRGVVKHFAVVGALAAAGYMFMLAFSRQVWPL